MKQTIPKVHNIYIGTKAAKGKELFETLVEKNSVLKIEKIVSNAARSPEGFWYCQKQDEFVLLLQGKAELLFEKRKTVKLKKGDYIFIPRRVKHRIERTSSKPECIWLTVFGKF